MDNSCPQINLGWESEEKKSPSFRGSSSGRAEEEDQVRPKPSKSDTVLRRNLLTFWERFLMYRIPLDKSLWTHLGPNTHRERFVAVTSQSRAEIGEGNHWNKQQPRTRTPRRGSDSEFICPNQNELPAEHCCKTPPRFWAASPLPKARSWKTSSPQV